MQGLDHYRSVGAYGAAAAEDRRELVLRMLEGAQDRIASARGHMQRAETADKGAAIGKAIGYRISARLGCESGACAVHT